jgi:hypothetical protein
VLSPGADGSIYTDEDETEDWGDRRRNPR